MWEVLREREFHTKNTKRKLETTYFKFKCYTNASLGKSRTAASAVLQRGLNNLLERHRNEALSNLLQPAVIQEKPGLGRPTTTRLHLLYKNKRWNKTASAVIQKQRMEQQTAWTGIQNSGLEVATTCLNCELAWVLVGELQTALRCSLLSLIAAERILH